MIVPRTHSKRSVHRVGRGWLGDAVPQRVGRQAPLAYGLWRAPSCPLARWLRSHKGGCASDARRSGLRSAHTGAQQPSRQETGYPSPLRLAATPRPRADERSGFAPLSPSVNHAVGTIEHRQTTRGVTRRMHYLILLVAVILNLVMATSTQSSQITKVITTGLALVLGGILLAEFLGVIPRGTATHSME